MSDDPRTDPFNAGAPTDLASDPYGLAGQTLSHYAVERAIGQGGMGVVYLAEDTTLGRPVALKFLPPFLSGDAEAVRRLRAEARAASGLDHPHICTVHALGETPTGQLFIAMAYVPGVPLQRRIEAGPLPVEEALSIAEQLASALAHAHAAGIVHRDVKPANLILTPEDSVKLVDFGIAKAAGVELTQVGATLGTVAYMSPEQAQGRPVDARTDVWAAGTVLYEMLTGRRPFRADYEQAVVYAVLHEEPPPLGEDVPPGLAEIVGRCLEKDPDARYPDAGALHADLEALRRGEAQPVALPRRQRGGSKRGIRLAAIAAAAVLLAVLGAMGWRAARGDASAVQKVAVLPFANVGSDPANQAFIDGLAYTIGATLGGLERFADRLSVLPADGLEADETSPREAARALGVDLVVSGSVQRAAERIRLTLDLYDADAGRRLGSRILDTPRADVLALQDSVALALAALLDVELSEGAARTLQAGGTTSPRAFDFYTQARGYLQRYEDERSLESAVQLFRQAIRADSAYALAWAGLGEAYWRRYAATRETVWADRAAEAAEHAAELGGDLASVRVTLGIVYKGTGRYEDAERELRRALALDPDHAEAHQHLAATYYYLGRLDEAEAEYKRAIALKPGYWGFYNNLGFLYNAQGRHEDAAAQYRRVVELRPDNPWGFNNLGAQFQQLGQLDSAAVWYRRAAEANPASTGPTAFAYKNLGEVHAQRRAFREAMAMHERAVALDSADAEAWAYLASAAFWSGDTARAAEAWHHMLALDLQTLDVNPQDADALSGLAVGYARTGQPVRARKALARLDGLSQKRPGSLVDMAVASEVLGDRIRALGYIERAFARGLQPEAVDATPDLADLREDSRYRTLLAARASG